MIPKHRIVVLVGLTLTWPAHAGELSLASTRRHFTVAEPIELAVADAAKQAIEFRHVDGSIVTLTVPQASAVISLKPGALKPGSYTARLGDKSVEFAVHPAEHANAFYTGIWEHAPLTREAVAAMGGWMYYSGEFIGLHPRVPQPGDKAEWFVEARIKPYPLAVLGGGHQLGLDIHNDWGDPWVQRAIVWRLNLAALSNRLYPMAGMHCFDEPGLTWWPLRHDENGRPADGEAFAIPHQLEEFEKLTGKKIPSGKFLDVVPQLVNRLDDWGDFLDLRLKYLPQAWWASRWGTEAVHPAFATINQLSSSYSPANTTDGVDGRQSVPYEIVCGHGGYSDQPFGALTPVRSLESQRGCARDRRNYYLPVFYTHDWAQARNGAYMSWASKLEGLLVGGPCYDFTMAGGQGYLGTHTLLELAEVNRRLALVGDVMNKLKKTPSPVAVLHSHRQYAHDLITFNTPKPAFTNAPPQYLSPHHAAVDSCFFRVMDSGIMPNWIDEGEVDVSGPDFLKQWKVIYVPGLAYARPEFRQKLEAFIASGGKLVQFKGDKLELKSAIRADYKAQGWWEHPNLEAGAGIDEFSWRKWDMSTAPTFREDLAKWLGPRPWESSNKNVFVVPHKAGDATYLLIANNELDAKNPRGLKCPLIAAETTIKLPAEGVVYDLFNGGRVTDGHLKLAAGDGACWLHLPTPPGKMRLSAKAAKDGALDIELRWGDVGYLPFRLRILDPAGNRVDELYRATPYQDSYTLGANAAPGTYTIEGYEWLTGSTVATKISIKAQTKLAASADGDPISIYFDDATKIRGLFAAKPFEPPYEKMNWDAKRVFGLDPKKFAVFGPPEAGEKIAAALRAKGMTVTVNPPVEIVELKREPGRGGEGRVEGDRRAENIFAHSIVLPDHDLGRAAWGRGHINRPVTATFPGKGRAFIQWGMSCFQAGWQNVFAFGDTDAAVAWLLKAINGQIEARMTEVIASVKPAAAAKSSLGRFGVSNEIAVYDTPVGLGVSPDGQTTYVVLYDGSVAAYDAAGKTRWETPRLLMDAATLAVSPKGDRLAVAGYPGIVVLDAATGKVLGSHTITSKKIWAPWLANYVRSVAWNSAGTKLAGGWCVNAHDTQNVVVLDAQGKLALDLGPAFGDVFGLAFVPGTDTLLIGGNKLTAVNAADGKEFWSAAVGGAQSFSFSADGKTVAAGGWGKSAGKINLADGQLLQSASFDAVVGGVALLPGGDVTVAVWGGTKPLYVLRDKPVPLLQSSFAFQDVRWSEKHGGLLACEQGGKLWLLGADGAPKAMLDEDAGTTIYRLAESNGQILVGRMNRVVQRLALR